MVTQAERRTAQIEPVEAEHAGREEEAIVLQEPIQVMLGGRRHEVPIPSYRANRIWRKAFLEYQKRILPIARMDAKDPESILANADDALGFQIDGLIDLLFLAAPELDREEIEGSATERELFRAAQEVCQALSPLSHASDGPKPTRGRR
jgi:hypothetical protein